MTFSKYKSVEFRDMRENLEPLTFFFFLKQCRRTRSRPGDGIDNDCDGKIDEELLDGIDSDGDGRIGEDLAVVNK